MADWAGEKIANLRELWATDLSTAEIGKRMGISKSAVVGKAHRLNLPARPSPIAGFVPGRRRGRASRRRRSARSGRRWRRWPRCPLRWPCRRPCTNLLHHRPRPTCRWIPPCAGAAEWRIAAGQSANQAAAAFVTVMRHPSRDARTAASTSTCRAYPARRSNARSCRCARSKPTRASIAWWCRRPPGCHAWSARSISTDAPRDSFPLPCARVSDDGFRAEAHGTREVVAWSAVPVLRHRHVVAQQGCRSGFLARGHARPHRAAVLGRQPRRREPAAVLQALQRRARGDGRLPGGPGLRARSDRQEAARRDRQDLAQVERPAHQARVPGRTTTREAKAPAPG